MNLNHVLTLLPNDKIMDCTKLKTSAEDKLNVAYMGNTLFHRLENIV